LDLGNISVRDVPEAQKIGLFNKINLIEKFCTEGPRRLPPLERENAVPCRRYSRGPVFFTAENPVDKRQNLFIIIGGTFIGGRCGRRAR
jgi:hypothetical protein